MTAAVPSKARAAVFYGPGKISLVERDSRRYLHDNSTSNGSRKKSIVLKVKSCSVCGYDAKVFKNGHKKVRPPVVLGHEICAETVEDLPLIKAGTRVAVYPVLPCLGCRYCKLQMYNLCVNMHEIGSTIDGGFAEYIKVPREILQIGGLQTIPDAMKDEEASLIEPLACCLNALSQVIQNGRSGNGLAGRDRSAAIIGDGPMGLIHLQLLKNFLGLKPVVIGKVSKRMEIARSMGAERTFFSGNAEDKVSEIMQSGDNPGYDLVVVAVGEPAALQLATKIASKGACINVFAGIKKSPHEGALLDPNLIHYNQISISGSFSSTPHNFKQAISVASDKIVDLSRIATHKYPLDDILDAISLTENYQGLRAAVCP